jgi:hypothetical protein
MDGQGLSPSLRDWFQSNQQVAFTLGGGRQSSNYEATRVDVLVPPFDSPARRLTKRAALAILVATVCSDSEVLWGTAHAMRVCGVIPTIVGISLGALLSERALYLLTATARRGGVISYGEVAWTAYGQTAEFLIAGLLHIYLLRMILFHFVAVRDLVTPLVKRHTTFNLGSGNGLLFIITVLFIAPFTLISRDMVSLRHLAYLSCGCLCAVLLTATLLAVLAVSASETTTDLGDNIPPVARLSENPDTDGSLYDIVTTFPSVLLSFVSSFIIILPLHAPLEQPTNERVRRVIKEGVILAWAILLIFGISTKIFGNHRSDGSMLSIQKHGISTPVQSLLFSAMSDVLRMSAALAILCSSAIIVHHCRANILECVQRHLSNEVYCCVGDICHDMHEKCPEECLKDYLETANTTVPSYTSQTTTPRANNVTFLPFTTSPYADVGGRPPPPFQSFQVQGRTDTVSEVTPLISVDEDSPSPDNDSPPMYTQAYSDSVVQHLQSAMSMANADIPSYPTCNIDANRPIRTACSVLIILFCYTLALTVAPMPSELTILATRSAANVWNLAKSSVGIMISFVVPVACFLRLHMQNRRHESDLWYNLAWFLVLLVSPVFLLVWAPGWLVSVASK